jgi:predicted GH43/DUF377 family glycosyl hydrolase
MSARPGWSSFNPSIAYSPVEGYKCIVRSSNYVITRGQYEYPGYIDTRNWVAHLDEDLRVTGMDEINQDAVRGPVLYGDVQHMEDARLIWHDDGYWQISGTLREHREDGVCRIAVDRLEGWRSVEREIMPSPHPTALVHEKNWMPMSDGRFVYKASPLAIYDPANGVLTEDGRVPYRLLDPTTDLRGGSQAIRILDGWLALVHEVRYDQGERQYLNRFIRRSGGALAVSPAFYFARPTIEFAAGLTLWDGQLVASFGLEDRLAMLAEIPLDPVLRVTAQAY